MTTAPTPTQAWQATVPDLEPLEGPPAIAERLLLLLHYGIDWETSWVADLKYRKTYWDEQLPGRVRRAAYRADTLDRWWSRCPFNWARPPHDSGSADSSWPPCCASRRCR